MESRGEQERPNIFEALTVAAGDSLVDEGLLQTVDAAAASDTEEGLVSGDDETSEEEPPAPADNDTPSEQSDMSGEEEERGEDDQTATTFTGETAKDGTKWNRNPNPNQTEQLSTVELEHRSLTTRESVLQTQRDSLQGEQASLQARVTSLDEDVEREMMSFCQSVEGHSEDLDLSTSGQRARQNKATSTLQRLMDTEQQLLRDIAEYEVHKEALAQLEADRCCQQQSLCDTAQTKKELEECLAREEETLEQLEEERQHVSKVPQCGDEFKRLRTELNSLHTGTMEEECAQLQQQVHMLQQQLHSKQQQDLRHQMHQPLCPLPLQQQQLPPAQEMHGQAGGESTSAGRGSCVQRDQGKTPPLSREPMTSSVDVMDDDDDDMTLPDLELSEAEREDAGSEGFRVCNRQKPVFKPIHC